MFILYSVETSPERRSCPCLLPGFLLLADFLLFTRKRKGRKTDVLLWGTKPVESNFIFFVICIYSLRSLSSTTTMARGSVLIFGLSLTIVLIAYVWINPDFFALFLNKKGGSRTSDSVYASNKHAHVQVPAGLAEFNAQYIPPRVEQITQGIFVAIGMHCSTQINAITM